MHICNINSLVIWMVQFELDLKNGHNLMLMAYNHPFFVTFGKGADFTLSLRLKFFQLCASIV